MALLDSVRVLGLAGLAALISLPSCGGGEEGSEEAAVLSLDDPLEGEVGGGAEATPTPPVEAEVESAATPQPAVLEEQPPVQPQPASARGGMSGMSGSASCGEQRECWLLRMLLLCRAHAAPGGRAVLAASNLTGS